MIVAYVRSDKHDCGACAATQSASNELKQHHEIQWCSPHWVRLSLVSKLTVEFGNHTGLASSKWTFQKHCSHLGQKQEPQLVLGTVETSPRGTCLAPVSSDTVPLLSWLRACIIIMEVLASTYSYLATRQPHPWNILSTSIYNGKGHLTPKLKQNLPGSSDMG